MRENLPVILVSGAAGFIGSHLCKSLLKGAYNVIGVDDLSKGELYRLDEIISAENFRLIKGNIADIGGFDLPPIVCMVHLASSKIPRYSSGWEVNDANLKSNSAVLDYCIQHKIRLLFASTSDVYGKNPNPPFSESHDCVLGSPENKRWVYATSKLHMEHALFSAERQFGLQFQIMRFFGCYGPDMAKGWWGGPQSVFIEQALLGSPYEIHGDGTQVRSYVYIDDLVDAVMRLVKNAKLESGIWNICDGPHSAISVLELARCIHNIVHPGSSPQFEFIPYSTFGRYEDVFYRSGTAEKAEQLLGWKAKTRLHEGLAKTIKALRSK
jgi:UDP-glucose 4-epimerase